MSEFVNAAFVQDYTTLVELKLQEMGYKLKHAVKNQSANGKNAVVVEQFGKVNSKERTTRHGDTPLVPTPHDKRWVAPRTFHIADLIDDPDRLRMIIDPQAGYAEDHAEALGRDFDRIVVEAMAGTNFTGENGTTPTTLPAGQIIPVDASRLTLDKLRLAKKKLMAAHVDVTRDPLFMAITAEQHDDLLGITNANSEHVTQSTDFNTKPVLVDGMIQRYMGYNLIHLEELQLDGSGDRLCPVWAKSGVCAAAWGGVRSRITERDDKNYSDQVWCEFTIGATRTQEEKVVLITCDES